MATKKVKTKSNQQLAYECQKFLKSLSIKLKFLESALIWAEGEKLSLSSKLDEFFFVKINTTIEPDNILYTWLHEKFEPSKIYFNEDFINLKKSLKKDIIEFEETALSLSINFMKENEKLSYKFSSTIESTSLPAKFLDKNNEERVTKIVDDINSTSVIYFEGNRKILEIPKKSIPGYSGGDIEFSYRKDSKNESLILCKINYNITPEIESSLYFTAIYGD